MTNHISAHLDTHSEKLKRAIRRKGKKTRLYVDHEYITRGHLATLSHSATRTYLVLAKYANYTTQTCFPSITRIMHEAGIRNRNTAIKALRALEEKRIIGIERQSGRRSNKYTLLDPAAWRKCGERD